MHPKKKWPVLAPSLCAALVIFVFDPTASAALVTIEANTDNYIRGGTSSSTVQGSSGSSDTLEMFGSATANDVRKIYARFDLSGMNADASSSATFTFTYLSGSGSGTGAGTAVWALNTGATGSSWDESSLTWDNAAANPGADINEFDSDAFKLITNIWVSRTNPAGTTFNVTLPTLGDYLQADNTVTIMMGAGRNGSNSLLLGRLMNVASSEHATYSGPELEFNQIPEPSSILLMGASGLLLLRRRR